MRAEPVKSEVSQTAGSSSPFKASLAQMLNILGRFGNMTFGGGSATIAVLHGEIVAKRKWITEEVFGLCYALSRVTPGDEPISV